MKIGKLVLPLIVAIAVLIFFQEYPFDNKVQVPSQAIVVYGDTRTNHDAHQKVVEAIMEAKPVAVFHTGDLVEDGLNPDHWAVFNEISSELIKSVEFYPALGNHEKNSQLYFDNFELPNNERWYIVGKNNIHFIILDSNFGISKDSEQYKWLEADLQSVSEEIKFVVAIFHHPPFSTGPHGEDEKGLRETIVPLFEQYGVDLVFSGHDHAYERSLYNNIYYIVTGGGGAPLYSQTRTSPYSQFFSEDYHFCKLTIIGNELTVDVFDGDLNLMDRFRIIQKR